MWVVAVCFCYAGDWNFTASDEDRFEVVGGAHGPADRSLADVFDEAGAHLVELFQASFTRRQHIAGGGFSGFSRLDRVYVSFLPAEILDRRPHSFTDSFITDPGVPSGHLPVTACLYEPGPAPPDSLLMARWIPGHRLFTGAVSEIMLDIALPDDPFERLEVLTGVLHEAGQRVRRRAAKVGAETFQEKNYWSLKAMRAYRTGDRFGLKNSLRAYPILAEWIRLEGCVLTQPAWFHEHLVELCRYRLGVLAHDLENDEDIPEWRKRGRREALARRAALWGTTRRKAIRFNIMDGHRAPAQSNEEAAGLLRAHWGPTFDQRPIDESALKEIVGWVKAVPDDLQWHISREKFHDLAGRAKDSSPGPDGLPYSAWTRAGPEPIDHVHDAYPSLLDLGVVLNAFDFSQMISLPKGKRPEDPEGLARKLGDTRPLNLSNAVAKIIASAINHTLARVCEKVVPNAQQSFIRGRSLISNVITVDAHAVHYSRF